MKTNRSIRLIAVVLILCSLLLAGCDDADWDLVLDALADWAEENGLIVDGEFQPGGAPEIIAKDMMEDWINSQESVRLDGLDVVRDIEKANQLSDDALTNLDTDKMREAIALRPNDWVLNEKDAVIWGAYHNAAAADAAILQSDSLLKESFRVGDNCVAARKSQLDMRISLLWSEINFQEDNDDQGNEAKELRELYEAALQETREIESSGWTDFCQGFSG